MKKGAFESRQTLLLFEVLIALVVIAAFYTTTQGEGTTNYEPINQELLETMLAYGPLLVEHLEVVESTSPSSKEERS